MSETTQDRSGLDGGNGADGNGAARIEEEVVVTPDGCRVITLFPAQDLYIANEY